MRLRTVFAAALLLIWALVLGMHVRREYFRPAEERLAEAARVLPPGVAYYAVFRGQTRVGWGQSDLDTLPAGTGFLLRERYEIFLPGLGEAGRTEVRTEARLDARLRVLRFVHRSGPPGRADGRGALEVEGEVEADSVLELAVRGARGEETRRIPIEDGLLLPAAWPLRLAAMGEAEPGDRYTVRIVDPASADVRRTELEVLERARRTFPDSADLDSLSGGWYVAHRDTVTAWRVVRRSGGASSGAWIDEDGRVLEGPISGGLRVERTAFELAFYARPWGTEADRPGEGERAARREGGRR